MAGGTSQRDDQPITDINLTPLVDVSLVLVIIFMAVAPFAVVAGIKVLESRAGAAQGKTAVTENVQVVLSRDGTVTINGRKADFPSLLATLQEALGRSKEKMVVLTADDNNRVGQVVEILDASKQAGAVKLAILKTESPVRAAGNDGSSAS
ncbi:MAG: biopolymer transporter ExbD [Elusimicrobia bacterium]|nr:biopolymer transporter ExbD [Elusimicrobiota bacterium]